MWRERVSVEMGLQRMQSGTWTSDRSVLKHRLTVSGDTTERGSRYSPRRDGDS
jgi:hypothetical protein